MCSSALALVAGLALAPAAYAQEATTHFAVPAQPLAAGLLTLGQQARISIAASTDLVGGKSGRAVQGDLSVRAALAQMLEGTGLRYEFVGGGAVRIVESTGIPQSSGDQSASGAEPAVLSEIMVTGTRIRGQAPVGSQLVTLGREELQQSGRATVAEALTSVPQIQSVGTTESTRGARGQGGIDNTGAGTAINLRGLGSDATLILVNGRRIAPSAAGAFVDVSQIPMAGVERVEILPDGASALYGSDAIGGVVNFVLRKHYEGAETSARYGVGDGFEEYSASQVFGKDWGSGSMTLAYEHFSRSNLSGRDRDYYRSDLTRFGGSNFLPQDLGDDQAFQSVPGTIVAGGVTYAIPRNQRGQGLTFADLGPAGSRNTQDPQLFQDILPAQKRDSVTASLQQELLPNLRAFADAFYSRRSFVRHIQPAAKDLTVLPSDPYFIAGIPGGEGGYQVRYAFSDDLDARTEGHDTNYTVTGGVDFDLPHGWSGEIYASKGQDLLNNVTRGIANSVRLDAAISGAGLPPGVKAFNPNAGGGGGNDPATLHFIEGSQATRLAYDVQSINGAFSGAFFELPGGTIRMAVGGDFRQEKLGFESLGDVSTVVPTPNIFGSDGTSKRDITAGYAELLVPIFGPGNARPGFQKLDLSLAVRSERYSDFGGTTNPKVGLSWKPFDDLNIRGSWSTSFKAPKLAEMSDAGNFYLASPLPNSRAAPGDPTTPFPGYSNTVILVASGNANLKPETAESWSFGADYRPSFLPGLKASFTYFTIKYENRILTPTEDELSAALASGNVNDIVVKRNPTQADLDAIYKSGILIPSSPLNSSDVLAILTDSISNYGAVKVDGLDADMSYAFDNEVGRFNLTISGTYLFRYEVKRLAGDPFVGLLSTSSNPNQFRAHSAASWVNGPYRASLAVNYLGEYTNSFDGKTIDPWITADLQLGYVFDKSPGPLKGLALSLDIENVTDEAPPFVNNGNEGAKIGYDPEAANARGRVISLSLRKTW
jgi:iron complex outermembrane receptor protein